MSNRSDRLFQIDFGFRNLLFRQNNYVINNVINHCFYHVINFMNFLMTPLKYCPPCIIALHHFMDYTGSAISRGKQLNDYLITSSLIFSSSPLLIFPSSPSHNPVIQASPGTSQGNYFSKRCPNKPFYSCCPSVIMKSGIAASGTG